MTRPALATCVLPLLAIVATGLASIYYYFMDDVLRAIYWLVAFGLMWKWLGTVIDDTIREYQLESQRGEDI